MHALSLDVCLKQKYKWSFQNFSSWTQMPVLSMVINVRVTNVLVTNFQVTNFQVTNVQVTNVRVTNVLVIPQIYT